MRYRTHVAAGMAATGMLCHAIDPTGIRGATIILGGALGALLPDIDYSGSKIASLTETGCCISVLLEDILGHRGLIHTPFAMLLLTGGFGYWFMQHLHDAWGIAIGLLWVGTMIGYASHLLLDTLTPMGIMPLYPFSNKRVSVKTWFGGANGESRLFSILFLIDVYIYIILQ